MGTIKHIVYLMLENRSLDNVLGWLYDKDAPKHSFPETDKPHYEGLKENTYFNLDAHGNKHYIKKGTSGMSVPTHDPNEEYEHVNFQLFMNQQTPTDPSISPTMGGFYQDYYTWYDLPDEIMQTYTPDQLPVLNGLAKNFAVSDGYYASIPTQTNCNRAFAATGNSLGYRKGSNVLTAWVNNYFGSLDPFELEVTFSERTMWHVLNEYGMDTPDDWMIYYSEQWHDGFCFTRDLLDQLQNSQLDPHFDSINTFFASAKAGTLPKFCFLEPTWGLKKWEIGWNGNDYHPPCNLTEGEKFLYSIYKALTSNVAAWNETLLIINFDEHGGTYDHMPPRWGALPPWSGAFDTRKPQVYEQDFKFDRFGVRVPLLLVSPLVEPSTVFRSRPGGQPYDHAATIATILELLGLKDRSQWRLGNRVFHAQSFKHVLSRLSPRTEIPAICDPLPLPTETADPLYNDLQRGIAYRILRNSARKRNISRETLKVVYDKHLSDVKTIGELSRGLEEALEELTAQPRPESESIFSRIWRAIIRFLKRLIGKE